MSQGIQHYPCLICGKGGHSASRCKEIGIPPDGFYKPSPGQHNHGNDEDEKISLDELLYSYKNWLLKALKYIESK